MNVWPDCRGYTVKGVIEFAAGHFGSILVGWVLLSIVLNYVI